jgi:hypothetical protein
VNFARAQTDTYFINVLEANYDFTDLSVAAPGLPDRADVALPDLVLAEIATASQVAAAAPH